MKDPYVYSDSTVLINNLNIKDEEKLNRAESDFVILAFEKLKKSNFKLNSIFDCLTIHKELFSMLYSWAGQIRTIDIYKKEPILNGKSVDYVFASYIETALNELQKEFELIRFNELTLEEKLNKICYFVSEFWHIHPFREGNTRTSAMFLYFLIKESDLHINIDHLSRNGKYFRNALVLSCIYDSSKAEYLKGMISDCVTFKNTNSNKYITLEGLEVNKYSYSKHTIKKIQTIKKI